MPISLDLVNFTEAFQLQGVKTIAESFERLGQWLTQRVKQADSLDRATSRIPVVWFYNDAVTLWIAAGQKDTLAPKEPPPSFGDHLTEGGKRFVAGIEDIVELPRESLVIPALFDVLKASMNEIVKSVERFHKPDKAMFEAGARTAADLFGEAALTWRTLYWSRDQLMDFHAILMHFKGPEMPGGPVNSVNALPEMLERVSRYIVAGLFLLTTLPKFIKLVWKEISLFIRAKALDLFSGIEAQGYGVRRLIIDIFAVDLQNSLRNALAFALAWRFVSTAWFALFIDLSEQFGKQIVEQFRDYFHSVSEFVNKLVSVFHGLESLLDELANIDLQPMLIANMREKSGMTGLLPDPPSLRLGDLADSKSRAAVNTRMQDWLSAINRRVGKGAGVLLGPVVGPVTEGGLALYLKKYRNFLDLALNIKIDEPKETSAFTGSLPDFPNIADEFERGMAPLRNSLADFVPSLQAQTKQLIGLGRETFDAIGTRFDRAAGSALSAPAAEPYLALSATAARMAEQVFPADDIVGGKPVAAVGDIAHSWESWLTGSELGAKAGFYVIGEIIPGYIAAMQESWAEKQAQGLEETVRLPEELPKDFPTSPHIMALHPGLARTLVPRVTIDASGRPLDKKLVQQVADAFLLQIQEAHREGLEKLAGLQAQAGV